MALRPRSSFVVLIVEDEASIRMVLADALTDAGFTVVEAEHGDQALEHLQLSAANVHAVFTDVHMPGSMNGVALVHQTAKCWPWIHLLVTSGHAMPTKEELPEECRFLLKPYRLAHVVRYLHEMASRA